MKYLELEVFNDFKCIGSACPFTCCSSGWSIPIDDETYEYYKTVDGNFKDRLDKCIDSSSGTKSFVLTQEGRCPFLNNDNLCDIYITLGEIHLCHTCKTYPRYSYLAGDIIFSGVSISCPEVGKYFFSHKEMLQIDFGEDNLTINNDINMDWNSFNHCVRAFTTAMGIVQNRNLTINNRLTLLTLFLYQFQSYIDGNRDPSGLIELFNNESYYDTILKQTESTQNDINSKLEYYSLLVTFFYHFKEFSTSLPELYELIDFLKNDNELDLDEECLLLALGALSEPSSQIWMEQLLVYTIFRYFMQGVDNMDFYDKSMVGLLLFFEISISTFILYYLKWNHLPSFDEMILIVAHLSRMLEHNENFRDETYKYFKDNGSTEPTFLLKLFS